MKKILITLFCVLPLFSFAQYSVEDAQQYIHEYKDYAIKLMREDLIPASVRLAQALHATEAGTNKLCTEANNHFAIPCPDDYQGSSFTAKVGNAKVCYQSYKYPAVSWADHTIYLRRDQAFAPIFKLPIMDYKSWAQGLQKGKYSTEPNYAQTIISIIEQYGLAAFDTMGFRQMEMEVAQRAADTSTAYIESGIEVVMHKQPKPKSNPAVQECKRDSVAVIVEKVDPALAVFTAKEFEYKPVYSPYAKRNVYENNKIKFVLAKQGDTYKSIAEELKTMESMIRDYNDIVDPKLEPIPGEVIYIQPKGKKSLVEYHTIQKGESVRYIAQKYAISLAVLFERNNNSLDDFGLGSKICVSCKK